MRLLDLFCGAGGAAMGYRRAGFDEIVGVDNRPQPHYPFAFVLGDALGYLAAHGHEFDAIHASPPCQAYSQTVNIWKNRDRHPDLVGPTRDGLVATGAPWVIENVPGAPLVSPIVLCGQMFGLNLYRHRLFESNVAMVAPDHPRHTARTTHGHRPKPGEVITVSGHFSDLAGAKVAMGIDWMTRDELAQAIPPAYTAWVGRVIVKKITSG